MFLRHFTSSKTGTHSIGPRLITLNKRAFLAYGHWTFISIKIAMCSMKFLPVANSCTVTFYLLMLIGLFSVWKSRMMADHATSPRSAMSVPSAVSFVAVSTSCAERTSQLVNVPRCMYVLPKDSMFFMMVKCGGLISGLSTFEDFLSGSFIMQ